MMSIFADSLMIATRIDREPARRKAAGLQRMRWFRRFRTRLQAA